MNAHIVMKSRLLWRKRTYLDETWYTGYLEYAEHDSGSPKVRKRPVLEILILVVSCISLQFQRRLVWFGVARRATVALVGFLVRLVWFWLGLVGWRLETASLEKTGRGGESTLLDLLNIV